jgi:Protein of unknown function (DUF3352)
MITDQVAPEAPEPKTSVSRLQVAVIAAVGLLAATIGLVLGLTVMEGRASTLAPAAGYVPSGAAMYLEADLSLPASQQASLQAILARFPGDKDAMLGEALAQTLDDALAQDNAPFDYSDDIAPWFEGTVAVALLDIPLDMQDPKPPAVAALVGVTDPAAATEFADTLRATTADEGTTWTSSDSNGVTIWVAQPASGADAGAGAEFIGEQGFAYAVTDDHLVMAPTRATIEALLAVHAGGDSLAERDDVRDLAAHLPPETAGVMTVNVRATLDAMREQMTAADPAIGDMLNQNLQSVPDMVVTALTFEDDAIQVETATNVPDGGVVPSNSQRSLAASVPADAIFFADAPNVGASLSASLAAARDQLEAGGASGELNELQQVEAALGGRLDELVDWIGGGAVAAGWDGEQPYLGLVLEVTDAEAADERLRQLQNLLSLATMDPSADVTVSTETVAGVEVTSIRFTTMTPTFSSDAGEMEAVIQYAMDGDQLLIGAGDSFVSRSLQLASGESLADGAPFQTAIERFGGPDNAGAFYLDLVGLRGAVETAAGAVLPAEYATEVAPYLEPLDYVAGVTRLESGAVLARYGLVLR